jgi:hypothetical protein
MSSIEYGVVSLLPDKPCSKHESLHEEFRVEICPGSLHHRMKGQIEILVNVQVVPALQTEGTREEEMECGFLTVCVADGAAIVIAFKLMLFSS